MHTCGQRVPKMSGSRRRTARTGGRLGSACAPAGALGQVMVRASPRRPPGVRDRARRPGPTTVPHPTGGRWICPRPKRSEVHVLITGVQLLSPATFHRDGYATQWSSKWLQLATIKRIIRTLLIRIVEFARGLMRPPSRLVHSYH